MFDSIIDNNEVAIRRVDDPIRWQVREAARLLAGGNADLPIVRRYKSNRGVTVIAYEMVPSKSLAIVFHAPHYRQRRDTPREPLEDTRCNFFADYLVLWSSISDLVDEVGAALAMIEAARIKCYRQLDSDRLQVVTFGCPPLGSPTILPELLPQSIHIVSNSAHVDEGGTILHLFESEFWDGDGGWKELPVLSLKNYVDWCSEWDGQVRSRAIPMRNSIVSESLNPSRNRDLIRQCVEACDVSSVTMLNQHCKRLTKLRNGSQIALIEGESALIISLCVDPIIQLSLDESPGELAPWSDIYPDELILKEILDLWTPLQDDILHSAIINWIRDNPNKDVLCTGFGLGACLAGLSARFVHDHLGKTLLKGRLAVMLFGCPPAWSPAFVSACHSRISRIYRIVYESDYLATVFSVSGLDHLGKILHFRTSGDVCDDFWSVWRAPNKEHSDLERYRAQVEAWDGVIKKAKRNRRKRRSMRKLIADDPMQSVVIDMAELSNLVYHEEDEIRSALLTISTTRPLQMVAFLATEEDCEAGVFRYGDADSNECDLAIVFRGSSSMKDVYHNLSISPVAFEDIFEENDDARVHQGFLTQFLSIRDQIDTIVEKYNSVSRNIIVCGHSLGAAISILCSMHLEYHYELGDRLIQIGFGGTRVGNPRFRKVFRSMVRNSYTIINDNDLVSGTLTFSIFGHVGRILHIRPAQTHLFDGLPRDWSPYSVGDHSILNYIERLRQWSGRVIKCPENEAIMRRHLQTRPLEADFVLGLSLYRCIYLMPNFEISK